LPTSIEAGSNVVDLLNCPIYTLGHVFHLQRAINQKPRKTTDTIGEKDIKYSATVEQGCFKGLFIKRMGQVLNHRYVQHTYGREPEGIDHPVHLRGSASPFIDRARMFD
jgi:hypothetical protein